VTALIITWVPVALAALTMLDVYPVALEGAYRLRAHMEASTADPEYAAAAAGAVAALVLLCVGVPVLAAACLCRPVWQRRMQAPQEDSAWYAACSPAVAWARVASADGGPVRACPPRCPCGWLAVLGARMAVLVLLIVLVTQPVAQSVLVAGALTVALGAHVSARPFRLAVLNRLEAATLIVLLLTVVASVALHDEARMKGASAQFLRAAVQIANAALAVTLAVALAAAWSLRVRRLLRRVRVQL
jgi:hypothetical protein